MSGIGIAMLAGVSSGGGGPPPPEPGPLTVTVDWSGPTPTNVAGASGTTVYQFFAGYSGGAGISTTRWDIISNASGKLGITNTTSLGGSNVTFSGFALNEQEVIGVTFTMTDSGGATSSATAAAVIKRTS